MLPAFLVSSPAGVRPLLFLRAATASHSRSNAAASSRLFITSSCSSRLHEGRPQAQWRQWRQPAMVGRGPVRSMMGLRGGASPRARLMMRAASSSTGSTGSGSAHPPRRGKEEEEEEKGVQAAGASACCNHSHSHDHKDVGKEGGAGAGWLGRDALAKLTVAASVLCAVDCTVFPVLLAILPAAEALGPAAGSHLLGGVDLHALSHQAALYVVLPIGSTTTLSNYYLHRDKPLAALSCAGLALIFGSNAPFDWLPAALHESRLWNTLGCGMLIGSSWLAHRGEAGGGGGHGHHSHVHGHSHGHEGEGEKGKEEKEK